jgi:hypothetical protein
MPRKPDPKCVACAQLSIEEVQHHHGPEGDDCWVASRCHRRRSHYRHRGQVNVQRREQYRANQHQVKVDELSLEVDLPPAAYLYLYRAKRADSPIHAVAVSVWQGDKQLLAVRPIHCAGFTGRQLKQYLVQVLKQINQRYPQISQFESEIRLEPTECPIRGCPLRAPDQTGVPGLVVAVT